jgi:hypothetical protein
MPDEGRYLYHRGGCAVLQVTTGIGPSNIILETNISAKHKPLRQNVHY